MRYSPDKKMHVGWDLDDVTTNLTEELLELYFLRTGRKAGVGDVRGWDFFPPEIHDEMISAGYPGLKPKEGALRSLSRLKEAGDEISIVTYRSPDRERATSLWLEKHIPGLYDRLCMTGGSKVEACRSLEVDVLVDDSARHAAEVSGEGCHVILLRTPMNENLGETEFVHPARDHEEVLALVEMLRKKLKG